MIRGDRHLEVRAHASRQLDQARPRPEHAQADRAVDDGDGEDLALVLGRHEQVAVVVGERREQVVDGHRAGFVETVEVPGVVGGDGATTLGDLLLDPCELRPGGRLLGCVPQLLAEPPARGQQVRVTRGRDRAQGRQPRAAGPPAVDDRQGRHGAVVEPEREVEGRQDRRVRESSGAQVEG